MTIFQINDKKKKSSSMFVSLKRSVAHWLFARTESVVCGCVCVCTTVHTCWCAMANAVVWSVYPVMNLSKKTVDINIIKWQCNILAYISCIKWDIFTYKVQKNIKSTFQPWGRSSMWGFVWPRRFHMYDAWLWKDSICKSASRFMKMAFVCSIRVAQNRIQIN